MRIKSRLLATIGLGIMAVQAAPVAAQGGQAPAQPSARPSAPPSAQPEEDDDDGAILVTGSRLNRRTIDSPAPIVEIQGDTLIGNTGRISLGDELNELPQFRSSLSQASSTANTATSQVGLNILDLRGMGLSRTLVLQNGRRHVAGSQTVTQPDVNTIPAELIDRVEILTGGASAVYGSDAIAGVVNFVLKDDYEGIHMRGQAAISERGDAPAQMATLTAGTNFAGGRGNVAASFAYARRERLRGMDRDFARFQQGFAPNFLDTDRLNPTQPPDGIPDQILLREIRLLGTSNGGTISLPAPAGQARIFRFAPGGNLNPANFGRGHLLPLAPISDGGDGYNSFGTVLLLPDYESWSANMFGHYDFTDDLRLVVEGKVNRAQAMTVVQATSSTLAFSIDNPFLTQQARNQLVAQLAPGQTTFVMSRVNDDLGITGDRRTSMTYRGLVGLRGAITDHWDFEISYSYGRTETDSVFVNNVLTARMQFAADAVRDPSGNIVCRARLAAGGTPTGDPDIDQCVPINLFGLGSPSQAASDFVTVDTRGLGLLQQHLIGGFVRGDTTGLLTLPGGPIAIVAGFEYREDRTQYNPDALDETGRTVLSGSQAIAGAVKVLEGYSEVRAPILANMPFAELLELTAAVRIADYQLAGVGTELSWGGGLVYAPSRDLRLRGSYQRAARSPNVAELFQPIVATRFSVFDPCTETGLTQGTSTRSANCTALGRPPGFIANTIGSTVPGTIGGNPNLDVERAETYTLGAVLTPRFLPRFSMTLDYYNIVLRRAITSINVNTILTQCVDEPTIDNVFCPLITRGPDFNITNINQRAVNLIKLEASGIDMQAHYDMPLGDDANLNFSLLATYVLKRNDYLSPTLPDLPTQLVEGINSPRFAAYFSTNLRLGRVTFSHDLRYFTAQYRSAVANFESVGGQPPRNPDIIPAEFRTTGDRFMHDARVGIRFGEGREFYFGVDNLFDTQPPPGINGNGFGGANFDNVGRFYYAGVSIRL